MVEIWTWGAPGSQIEPRLIPEARNRPMRPFWTSKWPQNDSQMEPFRWEIIAICHVISVSGGTAKVDQKWSQKKLARVPSMQITFFRSKTAAQYPARQRGASKNWREFRPCRSHFFEAKRPHSTQRVREVHQKIGESSVHADHIFSKQNGRTVSSESERCIEKLARVPFL